MMIGAAVIYMTDVIVNKNSLSVDMVQSSHANKKRAQ